MIYRFEDCDLDTATQEFRRAGQPIHLEPQVFSVLEYLVRNRDRVVTKIDLLDDVWGDRFVSESALTSRIKSVRSSCGDTGREQRVLRTVHGRGYRFVAAVEERRGGRATVDSTRSAPSAGSGSVVGRVDDIDRLESALAAAAAGSRQAVFVTGAPGVGKSTVVAELLERTDDADGWSVMRGQCLQQRGGTEPYFAVLDALSHLARSEGVEVVDGLERHAPSWLAQMPSLVDDERARRLQHRLLGSTSQRMLREGVEVVEGLAGTRPVILIIEDLQWADGCTLDVLELLVQRSEPASLLVIGTSRTEAGPAGDLISDLTGAGRSVEVRLGGLDDEAVDALVADWFGGPAVPDELLDVIRRRGAGIPLFVQEILATWVRRGHVNVDGEHVVLRAPVAEIEATVPEGVQQLIERQLAELDPDQVATLEAAAVVGTEFDGASTAAGLGRPLPEVEAVLGSMGRNLPYVDALGGSSWPDGTVSTRFSFTHDLYRLAVYERTSAARRAALHGAIGEAIERGHQSQIDESVTTLAHHFGYSGDNRRAVKYLTRAGERAAARSAHSHAAGYLLDALERVGQFAAGPDRNDAELQVRMALGPTLVAVRGWFGAEVSENYERAMELCDARPVPCHEAAMARYGLATVTELRGEYERTEELLLPLLDDTAGELAVETSELLACSTFHQGAFRRSFDLARTVVDSEDEIGSSVLMARMAEHPEAACNSWASLAAWFLGRSDESLLLAERAIEVGEANLYALSTARVQRAFLHQYRNEPEDCGRWADEAIALADEQGFPMRSLQAGMLRGWVEAVTGSPEAGADRIATTLERYRSVRVRLAEPYFVALEAEARLLAGDTRTAGEALDEAESITRQTSRQFFHEPELYRLRARWHIDREGAGAVDAAREALDQSMATARQLSSPPLQLRAAVDRLRLERDHGDADPWRAPVEVLVAGYAGQVEIADVLAARETLSLSE